MMANWITIALLVLGSALFYFAIHRGETNAWQRRSIRLAKRPPHDRLQAEIPEVPQDTVNRCLNLIGKTIGVEPKRLRLTDRLDGELSILDGQRIMVESDDTSECICDEIEDLLGSRPRAHWKDISDIVREFWLIESHARQGRTMR